MSHQKTLRRPVEFSGITLHSGDRVRVRLHPARHDSGITFIRSDVPGGRLRLRTARVVRADHATTLEGKGFTVTTVEHLLAALRILGVDNALIELDGPEVPIMDGSAAPFVYLIKEAGTRRQRALRECLVLRDSIEIRDGDREIAIHPAERLKSCRPMAVPGKSIV